MTARARWLFDFGREELTGLGLDQREQIATELEEWINAPIAGRRGTRPMAFRIDQAELLECYEWLRNGLQRLARGDSWTIAYVFPPRYSVRLNPPSVTWRTGIQRAIVALKQITLEDVVPIFLRHLRLCERKGCDTLFWRRGRGRYCSPRCGTRVRTAAWRREHPEGVRVSRRNSYVTRLQAKTSKKVRVAHRPRRSGQVDAD